MRNGLCREEVDSCTGPGKPCGTAVATALPLYHSNSGNTRLTRPTTPFTDWQLSSHQACPECCLPLNPLNGFPHKRCEG
jgi:hypothetical protein